MRKFLLIVFIIVRLLFDASICADAHSSGGGEEFGGISGGGGSDFGYDSSIFVDHDAANSYSLTTLNQVTCDASVSVDKVLVSQDSLELSRFSIRPVLSDNAAGSDVTLTLYAGYDQYDLHKIKTVKYEMNMMIEFVWSEFFQTDLMKLEKIHFLVVPEVETEDFSKPKTYTFPVSVTTHDCDAEGTEYKTRSSSVYAGTYLMKLYGTSIKNQVEKDGIFVLLWTKDDDYSGDDAYVSARYLFYFYDSEAQSWDWDAVSDLLYTQDLKVREDSDNAFGCYVKKDTVWSDLFSFQYQPQFIIPWTSDVDYAAIPALYFDNQNVSKRSTGRGFYCSFPMNNGIMQRTGTGSTVGDGDSLDDNLDKNYDAETGEKTDSSKGPLDTVLDFLFGSSELEKLCAVAFRKIPFSFFTYLSNISGVFVSDNYNADKLRFTIPLTHLGISDAFEETPEVIGGQELNMEFDIFKNDVLIHNLVHNLFKLLLYAGTGLFLFGIIQKTANFLSD